MATTKEIDTTRAVTLTDAKNILKQCFKHKRPVFMTGGAGIGKSDLIEQIATEMNGALVDVRLAQMEPTDVRGIPFYNKDINMMDWAQPIDLPSAEFAKQYPIVVLFLDELSSAPPSVQASAYQLILNRRVGKYVLPDNVVIAAAGNRESDRGVTFRMPAPLANRFIHVDLKVDFDSWLQWAVDNGISSDIIGYLTFAKSDLYNFDQKSTSKAFPTPRTWSFVNQLLDDDMSDDLMTDIVVGAVGEGAAVKFMAHRKVASSLPTPSDIISGKVTTLDTDEISAMYSLTSNICYELKNKLEKVGESEEYYEMLDNFINFSVNNFSVEISVVGVRMAFQVYKLPLNTSKMKSWDAASKKIGKHVSAAVKSK